MGVFRGVLVVCGLWDKSVECGGFGSSGSSLWRVRRYRNAFLGRFGLSVGVVIFRVVFVYRRIGVFGWFGRKICFGGFFLLCILWVFFG